MEPTRIQLCGRMAVEIAGRRLEHELPGKQGKLLFLSGCEAPWIEERRRFLEAVKVSALECVGEAGLGLGGSEIAAADRSGRALIEIQPYRESGYRLLMRALQARGNYAAALA